MPLHLSWHELRSYNEEERAKWDRWFRAHGPGALALPFQRGERFATVWKMVDHIFVVERRHLQRLRSEYPLPETTGAADWLALIAYARAVRAELVDFVEALSDADEPREFPIMGRQLMITPRKLLFHIFVHEARHWSQIALALRNAGFEPPPDQDLVFSSALS